MRAVPLRAFAVPTEYGWPDLSQTELEAAVHREVRLLHGGGIALNHYALRLRETDSGVTGELLAFWPTAGTVLVLRGPPECQEQIDAEAAQLARLVAHDERAARGCPDVVRLRAFEVCRAEFRSEMPWAQLLQRFDSLDLWSMPDIGTLPGYQGGGLDGVGLEVELRDRTTFRRFDPALRYGADQPETLRAQAVNAVLLDVLKYPGNAEPPPQARDSSAGAP